MNPNTNNDRTLPTVDRTRSEAWFLAETVLGMNATCVLHGPAGTGKTYAAATITRPGSPVPVVVTMTDETSAADLLGHYIAGPNGFEWKDGPAVLAMRAGARLVINEIDHASGDAIAALYAIADERDTLARTGVALGNGEHVFPAAGFHVVATSNAEPADALRGEGIASRFALRVHLPDAHPAAVDALPEDCRKAAAASCLNPDPEQRLTLRSWRIFADLRRQIGQPLAAALAFGPGRADAITDSLAVAAA